MMILPTPDISLNTKILERGPHKFGNKKFAIKYPALFTNLPKKHLFKSFQKACGKNRNKAINFLEKRGDFKQRLGVVGQPSEERGTVLRRDGLRVQSASRPGGNTTVRQQGKLNSAGYIPNAAARHWPGGTRNYWNDRRDFSGSSCRLPQEVVK